MYAHRYIYIPMSTTSSLFTPFTSSVRIFPTYLEGRHKSARTGNSNFHGARTVHQIILMVKWIRTSGLPIQNSLSPNLRGIEARLWD